MDTRVERSLSVLATEKVNPATAEIDRMSPLEIVQVINNEDAKVAQAVRQVLPSIARAIEEIASRLRRGGRLVYAGAGTSGRLGALDASEFYQRERENEQFGARDASRSYAIGVDGGGSKTLAVVVDAQGNERGRGIAGSANYATVGIDQAVSQIRNAVEEAVRAASCSLPLSAAWLGLAGIDRPGDNEILLPHLRSVAEFILLTNDAELVLSALDDAVGIALIAGTGSIALGRDAHGTVTRTGGWGYIIGDEGSGYDIGRRCLQAVSRAVDGRGQMTALVGLLLQHWNLTDASDIIGKVYPDPGKAAIASLSALVFRAARAADEIASEIVQSAADELALAAVAVRNALDFPGEVSIALGGGLLLHEADFRAQVLRGIGKALSIRQVVLVEEPALSAARAAIKLA